MENLSPEQREKLWRRSLSGANRQAARGQPEVELEARLTDALAQLRNAPVPSNFTARVMAAIDLEDAPAARSGGWRWNWHALLPRVAVAMAIVLFAGLGFQRYQVAQRRAELDRTLSVVAGASAPVPSMEVLENLDAIQRMGQSSHADTELLADLQP
ncbi:MAG: hypothetical protein ABSH48_04705 [Verrucomicrobiota bacterium]